MKTFPRPDAGDRAFFRSVLPGDAGVRVRPMFGNDAAFVNGNMFAGLFGRQLFVRLSDPDQAELLKEEGASRFAPMEGRPMRGYVVVPQAWRADPQRVRAWVARSLAWTAGLPPKAPKKR
ncbi:MAG: TfoX/Sxy family protein [Nitrososphaerales archaeon]|jgi:TfoX/Sxy family transcriptional regulator of competence genes